MSLTIGKSHRGAFKLPLELVEGRGTMTASRELMGR